MRLSWNEVRVRAASFAEEWRDAAYEKGETQSFYNDFFEVFDVQRRSVARYEEHVAKLDNGRGFIDQTPVMSMPNEEGTEACCDLHICWGT